MNALAYAALWCFVFAVPWENVVVLVGVGAFSRLVGMVALGFALLALVTAGRFRRWHLWHVVAFLFLLWTGASQLFLGFHDRLSHKFVAFIQLFVVVWMIWQLAPSRQRQIGLLTAYVFGAYVAACNTILVSRREAGILRRFAAQGFDPNDLAMILALALPMAWYLGTVYRRPAMRWLCRAYVPVGLVTIGLTGSRGGMLASFVGLLIVPLTMTKLSPSRLVAAMLMLTASGTLAVAYIPETAMARLASTGSELGGGRLGGRMKLWTAGIQAFAQKPMVGHGSGSFKSAISPVLGAEAQVAHNSYLSVLVEQGMIGFLIFAAMFAVVFLALLPLPLLDRRFALVMFATLLIAMLPLSWEDHKSVWVILAILLGLSQADTTGAQEDALVSAAPQPAFPARLRGRTS